MCVLEREREEREWERGGYHSSGVLDLDLDGLVLDEAIKPRGVDRVLLERLRLQQLPCQATQYKNNCLAEIWSGSEEGSYSRLIDCCITQL